MSAASFVPSRAVIVWPFRTTTSKSSSPRASPVAVSARATPRARSEKGGGGVGGFVFRGVGGGGGGLVPGFAGGGKHAPAGSVLRVHFGPHTPATPPEAVSRESSPARPAPALARLALRPVRVQARLRFAAERRRAQGQSDRPDTLQEQGVRRHGAAVLGVRPVAILARQGDVRAGVPGRGAGGE